MKEIKLANNEVVLVNDEDYDILMQHKWSSGTYKCNQTYKIKQS